MHPVDGGGQPNVLTIAEAFIQSGVPCSAILDNETTHLGRRTTIEQQVASLVWRGAVNIEDAVCKWVPLDSLLSLLPFAHEASGTALRYLEDQVFQSIPEADRQNTARDLQTSNYPEQVLRIAFYSTMHGRAWFKSRKGGRALARGLKALGMPPQIEEQFATFAARLRLLIR